MFAGCMVTVKSWRFLVASYSLVSSSFPIAVASLGVVSTACTGFADAVWQPWSIIAASRSSSISRCCSSLNLDAIYESFIFAIKDSRKDPILIASSVGYAFEASLCKWM